MCCDPRDDIQIPEGIIEVDSQGGVAIGFTSNLFASWSSYLWKKGNSVYISFIESRDPGNGSLRSLFEALERRGLTIKVPTPFPRMLQILQKQGFTQIFEEGEMGMCEVWIKIPGYYKDLIDEAKADGKMITVLDSLSLVSKDGDNNAE